MKIALYILFFINCGFLILVVLLQAGRGGGIAFSAGAQQQIIGSRGAANILQKLTMGSAAVFMLSSMLLARLSSTTSDVTEGTYADETPELGAGAAGEAGASTSSSPAPAQPAPAQ